MAGKELASLGGSHVGTQADQACPCRRGIKLVKEGDAFGMFVAQKQETSLSSNPILQPGLDASRRPEGVGLVGSNMIVDS